MKNSVAKWIYTDLVLGLTLPYFFLCIKTLPQNVPNFANVVLTSTN